MMVKIWLLAIVVGVVLVQCYAKTTIKDFSIGKRFRVKKKLLVYGASALQVERENPKNEDCTEEEHCSEKGDFQFKKYNYYFFKSWLTPEDLDLVYYAQGAVSTCKNRGAKKWIISGGFTGCLMTEWYEGSENRYVGHVDTKHTNGKDCTTLMKDIGAVLRSEGWKGNYFVPAFYKMPGYNRQLIKATQGHQLSTFGLVSDEGKFYTILAYDAGKVGDFHEYEVLLAPYENKKKDLTKYKSGADLEKI